MTRRAAVLLELVLSLAVFLGAALALTRVLTLSVNAMQRAEHQGRAVDLARSAMALIEAGVYQPEALQGEAAPELLGAAADASAGPGFGAALGGGTAATWRLDIETERSSFPGLTLVAITATRETPSGDAAAVYTLRQLVRLAAEEDDRIGDEDDITRAADSAARAPRFAPRDEAEEDPAPPDEATDGNEEPGDGRGDETGNRGPARERRGRPRPRLSWCRAGASGRSRRRHGFTLLEVLVAIVVLGVLAGAVIGFAFRLLAVRTTLRERAARGSGVAAVLDRIERDILTCVVATRDGASGVTGDAHRLSIAARGVEATAGAGGGWDRLATTAIAWDRADGGRITAQRDGAAIETVVAPVRSMRVRYFNGSSWADEFDSGAAGTLPVVIEIAVWFGVAEPGDDAEGPEAESDAGAPIDEGAEAAELDAPVEGERGPGGDGVGEADLGPPDVVRLIAVPDAAWLSESAGATP